MKIKQGREGNRMDRLTRTRITVKLKRILFLCLNPWAGWTKKPITGISSCKIFNVKVFKFLIKFYFFPNDFYLFVRKLLPDTGNAYSTLRGYLPSALLHSNCSLSLAVSCFISTLRGYLPSALLLSNCSLSLVVSCFISTLRGFLPSALLHSNYSLSLAALSVHCVAICLLLCSIAIAAYP